MTAEEWSAILVGAFVFTVPVLVLVGALGLIRVMDWFANWNHRRRSRQRLDW